MKTMKAKKIWHSWLVNINKPKKRTLVIMIFLASLTTQAQTWSLQQCNDTAQVYNKNLQIKIGRAHV